MPAFARKVLATLAATALLAACNGHSSADNRARGTIPADSTAAHVAPAP